MTTSFEWDPNKAAANLAKHGVHFAESILVFEDDCALTIKDDLSEPSEERFISIGVGLIGRLLVVVYTYRANRIRLISAREANRQEREQYEAEI
jgi:uncharacterized DUF497 family protein